MPLTPPLADADHLAGPDDALVTLVQYGDFECPYSKDVHDIVREIRDKHPMGVRFAFRHYPLRPHPNALAAAVAAEEAARQGGFWLLHDRMYAHQLTLRPSDLAAHADAVGLDGGAVRQAVDAKEGADEILAQKKQAVAAGVRTTLGLWIDGEWVEEDALEEALVERVIKPLHAAGL
ncbi:DsbA family protein [Rubrivirga sp. IMCC43871]|uniref:DsbA family protein n=1 Tax=Rubrivirga sp. IMCC43871 TaxID=3391575 RepID=UPI00398FA034